MMHLIVNNAFHGEKTLETVPMFNRRLSVNKIYFVLQHTYTCTHIQYACYACVSVNM